MPATGESPEYVQNILESLRKKEGTYEGGDDIKDALSSKNLTIVAGPIGLEKVAISNEAARISLAEDLEVVRILSSVTRARRADDPIDARTANDGVTFHEINDAVINDNLVNFHIVGQDIEATYRSGFPGTYNVGPAPTKSILQLLNAGFRDYNVAFMVTDGETHERRLRTDYAHRPDFIPQLIIGHETLDFAEMNIEASWLYAVESHPEDDGLAKAARKVINIARHQTSEILTNDRALRYIDEMRQALQRVARDVH